MGRLTLNGLLSLIFQAKKSGKGRKGNGIIYIRLMQIISDRTDLSVSSEEEILSKYSYQAGKSRVQVIDKFLSRYLNTGKYYPFEMFSFQQFEKSAVNIEEYKKYLSEMKDWYSDTVDEAKTEQLVYTLLELMKHDEVEIIYGGEYKSISEIKGNYAHPSRICPEALILGILHWTHKNLSEGESATLLEVPEKLDFITELYKNEKSLVSEIEQGLENKIKWNISHQRNVNTEYKSILKEDNGFIEKIPENSNVFIYGERGSGKSTLLKKYSFDNKCVYLQMRYYSDKFKGIITERNIWVTLQILLKYVFQCEYSTYEMCCLCEGKENVLKSLNELEKLFSSAEYTVILDGIDEVLPIYRTDMIEELEYIFENWKNTKIIVSGTVFSGEKIFTSFRKIKVCGVSDEERDRILSENNKSVSRNVLELLNNPFFLKLYSEGKADNYEPQTYGELIDYDVMNSCYGNDSARFTRCFILPFTAKNMSESNHRFINRADISRAVDLAFKVFIENETVYQNFTSAFGINRNRLADGHYRNDYYVDEAVNNSGYLTESFGKLSFTHSYYADYFSARHIVNISEAVLKIDESDERKIFYDENKIGNIWFNDDSREVYKIIGHICGDYKNLNSCETGYTSTILDKLLNLAYEFYTFRLAENVIQVMSIARKGLICNVDFSKNQMPVSIPCNVKFSKNGEYPCSFRECQFINIGISEDEINGAGYSENGMFIAVAFDNGYVIVWNDVDKSMYKEFDLSEYTRTGREFEFVDFLDDERIKLVSCHSCITTNIVTGDIFVEESAIENSCDSWTFEIISEYDRRLNCAADKPLLPANILSEIREKMNHFKNCDFTDADIIY